MRIQSFGQPDHHFPSYAPGMRHAPGPEWEPASPWCWLLPWQRQPGGEWKKDQVMCIDVCCIWYTLGDAIYIYTHTHIISICIFIYIYIYHINWHIYEALASWDVPPRYERRDPDLIKKGASRSRGFFVSFTTCRTLQFNGFTFCTARLK